MKGLAYNWPTFLTLLRKCFGLTNYQKQSSMMILTSFLSVMAWKLPKLCAHQNVQCLAKRVNVFINAKYSLSKLQSFVDQSMKNDNNFKSEGIKVYLFKSCLFLTAILIPILLHFVYIRRKASIWHRCGICVAGAVFIDWNNIFIINVQNDMKTRSQTHGVPFMTDPSTIERMCPCER